MREAPPPSATLLDLVASMKPVRTRVPWRAFVVVLAIWIGWGALTFSRYLIRPDLPHLPRWWIVVVAAIWSAALLLPLHSALVPLRRQVLPDPARASVSTIAVVLALLAVTFFFTIDAPGHSWPSEPLWETVIHCAGFVLKTASLAFLAGLLAIRKLAPVGSWRTGAALGAAGGALGGLLLHFLCPYASALHVGLGHAGSVGLCALVGAAVAPLVVVRRS